MESEKRLSLIEQLIGIVYNPIEVFEDLVKVPRWIFFFSVLALLSIVLSIAIWQIPKSADALKEMVYEQIKKVEQERGIEIPESTIETQLKISKYAGPIIAPLSIIILAFLIAGIVYLISYLFLSGKASFLMHFYVVIYSSAISLFNGILYSFVLIVWGKAEFAISLILFFPFIDEQHWIYPFLENFNLMYLWQMIVVGLGLKVINQWKTHKGMTVTVSLYVFYVILMGLVKSLF